MLGAAALQLNPSLSAASNPESASVLAGPMATGRGNFFFDPTTFNRTGLAASCNACVTDPSLRTYGTLPRNFFNRPGRANFDIGLAKMTPLYRENVKLEFKAEMFNAFNNVQWGLPNTTFTSSQFGQISTTEAPRIIQFALKLIF